MRKSRISALVLITILFITFTIGFLLGRNQNRNTVSVTVPSLLMEIPSVPTEKNTEPIETTVVISFPISINHAEKEELMALPGIGEVLAQRIIAYRQEYGAFQTVEDLLNVEGIGKKRLEEIVEMIIVGG